MSNYSNKLSKEYRIFYYLGDLKKYYLIPNNHEKIIYKISNLEETFNEKINAEFKKESLFTKHSLKECQKSNDNRIRNYCNELNSYLDECNIIDTNYFYFNFGDTFKNGHYFNFSKTRSIFSKNNSKNNILLNLNILRHWGNDFKEVQKVDIPFHSKHNKVIWRGSSTGLEHNKLRDNLVKRFQHFDSNRIDVKYSFLSQGYINNNNQYNLSPLSIKDLLKCKFIISIEGNDVATNLKWIMNSNSVVFMPKPKIVSWFMEDHLIPNVHYIEIADDFHDLEDKLNWCMYNLNHCEKIIKNANEYVSQFLDEKKEKEIRNEVIKTYFENIKFEMIDEKFRIKKIPKWNSMLISEKVYYYGTQLNQNFAPFVDKIEVKNIVKNMCGDKIKIAPLVRIISSINDLTTEDISEKYMLKSTHGSSWNMSLTNKTTLEDMKNAIKLWNKPWVFSNEKQYSFIKPRFFLEEKIDCIYNGKNGDAVDIKIQCIFGQPIFIVFKINHIIYFYSEKWEYLDDQGPKKDPKIEKPYYLDEVLELTKILAKPFEFVRVDFYIAKDGIYFGEYIFTPANGTKQLNDELEIYYGNMWN